MRHFHETDLRADPEVIAALEQAARVLADQGATISTCILPTLDEFAGVCRVILASVVWRVHVASLRSQAGEYGSTQLATVDGRSIPISQ